MTATIGAFDAKARFGELLDRVAHGEEIVITRHDKPVARIVPEDATRLEDVRRALDALRELRRRIAERTKGEPPLNGSRSARGHRGGTSLKPDFVADARVSIAWVHPAQATTETDAMFDSLGDGVFVEVPAIWSLEVANALWPLVRRRRMTDEERQSALSWLLRVRARVDHETVNLGFTKLSELAVEHRLSVYDAAYLELAQRRKLPLGCKDGPRREAAKRAGVPLWT
jgi:prevent-host-death family protein